ncbi:MAG: polyhydroxyalkanoate synthesis repressor PhaR [Pseudomonadales bacterium]|nr:polyhydroxyalkanoate synthesis repressor PhaR [Pseudomonadales bacterium]
MRILKKYPNRRLYDTRQSVYVTLEDVRQMVLADESIQVVDSKTGADLTRSVLLQIIAEQEGEGHEPLLTNRVLQQLIRFYGDSMQGVLGRYLEQSLMIFLEQQELYRRRMRDVLSASPLKVVQRFADQNIAFWRNVLQGQGRSEDGAPGDREPPRPEFLEGPAAPQQSDAPETDAGRSDEAPEPDRDPSEPPAGRRDGGA